MKMVFLTWAVLLDFVETSNAKVQPLSGLMVIRICLNLQKVYRCSNVDRVGQGQHTVIDAVTPYEQVENGNDGRRRRDTVYEIAMDRRRLPLRRDASSQHGSIQENLESVVEAARRE
jgi:hypothetical protein